jgi:hypothetical protein
MKKLLPMPALAVEQQCIRAYRAGRIIPDRWRRADSVRRLTQTLICLSPRHIRHHLDPSIRTAAQSSLENHSWTTLARALQMKLVSTHIDQSVNIPALSMCQTRDNEIGKEQNDSEAV